MSEEIEYSISPDGTVEIDMIKYKGKACEADLKKIVKELGLVVKSKKKQEYFEQPKTKIKGNE